MQIRVDDRRQSEPRRQRCRGLGGAAQLRDVDGFNGLAAEPLADQYGLAFTVGVQRRVTVAVDQRKRRFGTERSRLAMADNEELRGTG